MMPTIFQIVFPPAAVFAVEGVIHYWPKIRSFFMDSASSLNDTVAAAVAAATASMGAAPAPAPALDPQPQPATDPAPAAPVADVATAPRPLDQIKADIASAKAQRDQINAQKSALDEAEKAVHSTLAGLLDEADAAVAAVASEFKTLRDDVETFVERAETWVKDHV